MLKHADFFFGTGDSQDLGAGICLLKRPTILTQIVEDHTLRNCPPLFFVELIQSVDFAVTCKQLLGNCVCSACLDQLVPELKSLSPVKVNSSSPATKKSCLFPSSVFLCKMPITFLLLPKPKAKSTYLLVIFLLMVIDTSGFIHQVYVDHLLCVRIKGAVVETNFNQ